MKVRVSLLRNGGRWLTVGQAPRQFAGTLLSGDVGRDGAPGMVRVFLFDGETAGPSLYDPKVKSVLDRELRIVGLERDENRWVLQEWECEVLELGSRASA